MWIIDHVVVPEEIGIEHFNCALSQCMGMCCVSGDAGAPLEEFEIGLIEDSIQAIEPFMDSEGIRCVHETGVFDYEMQGHLVTALKPNEECVFVKWENGHTECAIENAHRNGFTDVPKPISCHLYPIRIETDGSFDRLSIHRWNICRSAIIHGKNTGLTVFEITKDALTRKYGAEWVNKLRKLISNK